MKYQYSDGGRKAAGFTGETGDCACRAIAIATGKPYKEVYDLINQFAAKERTGKRKRGMSSARTGVHMFTFRKVMDYFGWKWVPTMTIGSGCKVHLRESELPSGRLIARLSRNYVAIIDGVIHDAFDPQRIGFECAEEDKADINGSRCVYGYFQPGKTPLT